MPYFVKRAVAMSLDKTMRERELVALLLTGLTPVLLTALDLLKGYRMLLEAADDLRLDIPDAPDQITMFVARAIVDELIPPADLEQLRQSLHGTLGGQPPCADSPLLSPRRGGRPWEGGCAVRRNPASTLAVAEGLLQQSARRRAQGAAPS
eukprot:7464561-Pyramimonas_sp.AAC.1